MIKSNDFWVLLAEKGLSPKKALTMFSDAITGNRDPDTNSDRGADGEWEK